MKQTLKIALMVIGIVVGLFALYTGTSMVLAQLVYHGFFGQNLYSDLFLAALAFIGLFFGLRWGVPNARKALSITFLAAAVAFALSFIQMLIRFGSSFPNPSVDWVNSMAWSRAHTVGEAPFLDTALVVQGRTVTLGMAVIALLILVALVWFGITRIEIFKVSRDGQRMNTCDYCGKPIDQLPKVTQEMLELGIPVARKIHRVALSNMSSSALDRESDYHYHYECYEAGKEQLLADFIKYKPAYASMAYLVLDELEENRTIYYDQAVAMASVNATKKATNWLVQGGIYLFYIIIFGVGLYQCIAYFQAK